MEKVNQKYNENYGEKDFDFVIARVAKGQTVWKMWCLGSVAWGMLPLVSFNDVIHWCRVGVLWELKWCAASTTAVWVHPMAHYSMSLPSPHLCLEASHPGKMLNKWNWSKCGPTRRWVQETSIWSCHWISGINMEGDDAQSSKVLKTSLLLLSGLFVIVQCWIDFFSAVGPSFTAWFKGHI